MAEDPKISLDPPPAEPQDVVRVEPDPAPAPPSDIPIFPDLPPAAPFDIRVEPDPPAAPPLQIPDPPLDPQPPAPFDIQTTPDGLPFEPIDPSLWPDNQTPGVFELKTIPDDLAAISAEVDAEAHDAGPGVTPLRTIPDDKAAIEAELEAEAHDAGPGVEQLSSQHPKIVDHRTGVPELKTLPFDPTIDDIVATVVDYDAQLASFLSNGLGADNGLFGTAPYAGALDTSVLTRWLKDLVDFDPGKVLRFQTEQTVLAAMNPSVARVFDPSYFAKLLLPGSMGHATTTLDTQLGRTMSDVIDERDAVLRAIVSTALDRPGGPPDVFGPSNLAEHNDDFSIERFVDVALSEKFDPTLPATVDNGVLRYDAAKYFETRDRFGAQPALGSAKLAATRGELKTDARLRRSAALGGVIRVGVENELDDGSVVSRTHDAADGTVRDGLLSSGIDDDDARVPLSFTDLRNLPDKNYRTVYFQPMNLTVSENISPEYTEQNAFGRVDSVVTYVKTSRSYSVSFEMHVFAPEDLARMYKKLNHLKSMVYPTYSADGLLRSGPVVKMRIGDLARTDSGGVPGIIKSLGIDFNEALWELKRGMKVPRSCSVSLEFLVLHEGPVGTLNGEFGVLQLPAAELSSGPSKEREPRSAQDKVAQVLPSKFVRMPRGF